MSKRPKVVFTFVEAGMGHIVPASGVCDIFEKKYGEYVDIERWKIFSSSPHESVRQYGQNLVNDVKKLSGSRAYALLEHYGAEALGSKVVLKLLDTLYRKQKKLIMESIKDKAPDMLFSSYYSPAHFTIEGKRLGIIPKDTIVATYIVDCVVYAAWDRRGDIYFANNDKAYNDLQKKGVDITKIRRVSPVIRHQVFEVSEDKKALRRELGIPEDNFTVVLSDGGYGLVNLGKFAKALCQLDMPITVIAVCGRNEALLKELEEVVPNSKVTFVPVGFTDKMLTYNSASDMFVGKGGFSAILESFYYGAPVIVSSFANETEKIIANYFVKEKGTGEIITNVDKFVERFKYLYEHREILEEYSKHTREFHDNSGAEQVADAMWLKLKEKYPQLGGQK